MPRSTENSTYLFLEATVNTYMHGNRVLNPISHLSRTANRRSSSFKSRNTVSSKPRELGISACREEFLLAQGGLDVGFSNCVYKLKSQVCPNSWIYLLIWVDDVQQFPIVDKGEVDVFLGIEIKRERSQRTR
uniref:Uncharacterized protein n=1 Tax=Hanusia phi TaxID=3032 RepID=A0A7S0EPX6_9CRYP|mmetsp:Transcript_2822/g.6760  ORF Transcript_2822/g.6760 Transcript_2822/m.6760 type:complete len:132 (+) Transcript_2822:1225-1620(+)